MGIFDNKKVKELQSTTTKLATLNNQLVDIVNKSTNWDAWRQGNIDFANKGTNYTSIASQYAGIGDPYLYNVYVRKAIHKIADSIASLGIKFYRGENEVPSSDRVVRLFDYINDMDDPYDFLYDIVVNLQRFGKAFVKFSDEELGGVPISMQTLPANHVKEVVKNGILTGWKFDEKRVYPPEQILFMRYRHPTNPYDGLSPLSSAIVPILEQFYAEAYNTEFFKNGGHPKGYWTRDNGILNPAQVQEANKALEDTFAGVGQAHKQLSVPSGLKYNVISANQKDMEFIALLERTRDDILFALDIPKSLIGLTDTTFNNMAEAKSSFWTNSLLPIIRRLESMIQSNFLDKRGYNMEIDIDTSNVAELQDDYKTQGETAKIYYDMGVPFSILNERFNLEFQEFEGWDAVPNQSANPFLGLEANVPEQKDIHSIIKDYEKQKAYQLEKSIPYDKTLLEMEYKSALNTMLEFEKEMYSATKGFYAEKYKEVVAFIKDGEETKSFSPDFITQFITFIKSLDYGKEFVAKLTPIIEKAFNNGVFRTYRGLGIDFSLNNDRAINHLIERGLKLKDSPKVVLDSIVNMLESDDFTIDNLAKDISKKWDEASLARAKNIAITETTYAYSSGRETGMKELGIKKKRWVNSGDSKVRHSHTNDATGEVALVGEKFKNGLMRPGDGDPSEACNCRCTLVSELE